MKNHLETIHNGLDIIDSRDIIARINYLDGSDDQGDIEELATLTALAEEAAGYAGDWKYGVLLIRDSYFTTFAQDFAADIGAIDNNAGWPLDCINWDDAADELKADYTSVDFDGVEYWVR